MKKKLVFSSLALGTLAVAVGAIAGATLSHPIAARAAQPMRLAEAEMDGMTAGASLSMTTGLFLEPPMAARQAGARY